jgi:hypothetical protein
MQRATSPLDLETKKLKTMSNMHNTRLFLVQFYPKLFKWSLRGRS